MVSVVLTRWGDLFATWVHQETWEDERCRGTGTSVNTVNAIGIELKMCIRVYAIIIDSAPV